MATRWPRPLRRLMALFTWRSRDLEMEREMAFHVESMRLARVADGMTADEADHAVRRQFGSTLRHKEKGHDIRSLRLIEDLVRDLRITVRGQRRSPGYAIAVVLTLALGIGGNAAMFSLVDQVLLRPLPYPDGDQLVRVYESGWGTNHNVASPANWLDWQRENHTFQSFASWRPFPVTLTGVGEPLRLNAQLVSSEFFPLLGVKPLLGRTVTEDDDRPNAPPVAVLSYRLWQTRFGGDPNVVGRTVQMSDRTGQIIGVMPAGFQFLYKDNDLWGANRLSRSERWRETSGRFIHVVGRLKSDTTLSAAQADMTTVAQRLAATYTFNKNTGVLLVPLREELTGQVRGSLLALYAAVAVLLSIACFNVANLLLARAASRRRDLAIRTSLGAGRAAIIRQLLVESVLLSIVGGALGVVLARWSLASLLAVAPADLLPVAELSVDRRVLGYALALSMAAGVIVGLAPALVVARRSLVELIRTGGNNGAASPRLRQVLVSAQVALTVVLLCGAGLFVRTIVALNGVHNGFDKQDILSMEIALPTIRYNPDERRVAFYRDAVAALRALPGVESAAAANSLPMIGSPRGGSWFHRLGTPELPTSERPSTSVRVVTAGYFRTLRIPIRQGREFADSDDAEPLAGFVVNETFARRFLADVDPLSASITVWMEGKNPYLPIIGVVGDVAEGSARGHAEPTVFYSQRRMMQANMTVFVRAAHPETLAKAAVAAIHGLDANLAVTKVRTFEAALDDSLARERLNAMVSAAFAVTGLVLASLGLYGLLAFVVTERTKEIGIRMALGAQLARVTRSVIGRGLSLVAVGAAVGVTASVLLLRWLVSLLFGVTPYDVPTYAAVLTLLCVVAALASYLPARRAARVDPLVALRQE